ncbi:MAG TPA: DUF2155 domain-containing protein [Methylocella sp.]|nr:DUF2155 domain-containing protein [Methylocella sp.]
MKTNQRPHGLLAAAGCAAITAFMLGHPALAARIRHPAAVFAGLDKITGRTITFEAAAGETVQFGTLQITERACYTHPATEAPQTMTFVEVEEVSPDNQYKRIFSGWMFAASPGLHGIEHPIYDIWLTGCRGEGVPEGGGEAQGEAAPAKAEPQPSPPEVPKAPNEKSQTPPPAAVSPPRAAVPPPEEPPAEPLGGEPGFGEQESEPPPLGEPIEVGPPPGIAPAPEEGRRPPVQRYYPSGPGADGGN